MADLRTAASKYLEKKQPSNSVTGGAPKYTTTSKSLQKNPVTTTTGKSLQKNPVTTTSLPNAQNVASTTQAPKLNLSNTTTGTKTFSTTSTTAPSGNIAQQDQIINNSKTNQEQFLKDSSNAYFENQKSMIESAHQQRLTELQKAYDDAVADGRISQEDAEKALTKEVEAINDNAYLNSQATNLSGESRGVGNSQQMLAMQQGDQRNALNQRSEARIARDERIGQIKDRLSRITNNFNLDTSLANSQYNSDLRGARAQADMQYTQGMSEMTMAEYKQALEMKGQLTLQEQQQLNELEQMEKAYGYDLGKMKMQDQYTRGQMGYQDELTRGQMELQQDFDLAKMSQQQKYQLEQMAKAFGYDLEKMSKEQQYNLARMAKQYGYDMNLQNDSQAHDVTMFGKEAALRRSLASMSGGGGGGSTSSTTAVKSAQSNIAKEYDNFKKAQYRTPTDDYYDAQKKNLGMSVAVRDDYIKQFIPPPAKNGLLNAWEKSQAMFGRN